MVDRDQIIDEIAGLSSHWHQEGALSSREIHTIARLANDLGPIHSSLETGCGKSTLLLSHLSESHLVFTKNGDDSYDRVKSSPLLKHETVTFIEGPTQRTLPRYTFTGKLQLALLDGPHGYPFPDLEYYYVYPYLEAGSLLLIDDIKIPSIRRMFDILKADDMYELMEIVDDNLSIFQRTSAPCLDPEGDGWSLEGYNQDYYEHWMLTNRLPRLPNVYAKLWQLIPNRIQNLISLKMRGRLRLLITGRKRDRPSRVP